MILNSVIAALVTAFRTAVSPTSVVDGPVPTSVNKSEYVLVGSTGDEGENGATVDLTLSDLGPGTWHDESGLVVCSAWSWSGGTDLAAKRATALQLATSCTAAVHMDRGLGGLLVAPGLAQTSDLGLLVQQTDKGGLCRVTFTVTYSHLNT